MTRVAKTIKMKVKKVESKKAASPVSRKLAHDEESRKTDVEESYGWVTKAELDSVRATLWNYVLEHGGRLTLLENKTLWQRIKDLFTSPVW